MKKKVIDWMIVLLSAAIFLLTAGNMKSGAEKTFLLVVSLVAALAALWDIIMIALKEKPDQKGVSDRRIIRELILLDEQEKPVKSWEIAGRISLVIGRGNSEVPVDVDLEQCEYAAMVEHQHAVLNFSLDNWYIEDLDSRNGVQVQKVEDGNRYRLMKNRPCKVGAGDIIYIANTRLLIT